jgi:hypothetical protein
MLAASLTLPMATFAHDDDDEQPFDEARLFFELNDTDGDLGIHGKIDGDEWKYLEIEDPRDRKMLHVWVRGRLRRQGLTELFFESAEPCFPDNDECEDPLDPQTFFKRFPEGEYDIEGYTLDGEERESEVFLSHVIPAAPEGIRINGVALPDDPEACLEGVAAPVVMAWDPVTQSHAARWADDDDKIALGKDGDIEVIYYEVVVEIDDTDYKSTTMLPPYATQADLSQAITGLVAETEDGEGEFKFELLVRIDNGEGNPGNKSAVESCFVIGDGGDDDA